VFPASVALEFQSQTLVGLVTGGRSVDEILADYPQLAADDVRVALEFAATAVSERQVPLSTSA
jgi:uncharacterized protein (DUF433 family)